jgi:hypothetical protein
MKTGDAESQARALHTVFMAMDASLQSTVEEQEKLGGTGEKAAERIAGAVESKMSSINQLFGVQANLSKNVIDEIGKSNPLLAGMLNDTDNLNSAWAKYRLTLDGVVMDFENITGAAAIAANKLNEIVKSQVQLNPSIVAANKSYKGMTDRIKELEKAQKGQSVKAQYNAKEESARLQKQIADIKKAAQDKIEGIRKATEAENTQLEIQKAQLRAQQQLIQGNMSAYAEEQMTIEQLMNEANRKDAEEAIIAKAEIDVKPLQDALDAMADKNEKMAKKAALAGESLSSLQTKANDFNTKLQEYTQNLNVTMFKYLNDVNFAESKEYKKTLKALEDLGTSLGIKTPAKDVVSQLAAAFEKGITADLVNLYTNDMKNGRTSYTKNNPFDAASAGITGLTEQKNKQGVTVLDDPSKMKVAREGNLQSQDVFVHKGRYYRIKSIDYRYDPYTGESVIYDANIVAGEEVKRALGGPVAAGQKYLVNDRINALGVQGEGFIPNVSGMVYPNAATMPKFNIPSGAKYNGMVPSNTSSSSNVYNIDIDLNGTTVTADDVLNSFKRELALINAKEGISRRVGA